MKQKDKFYDITNALREDANPQPTTVGELPEEVVIKFNNYSWGIYPAKNSRFDNFIHGGFRTKKEAVNMADLKGYKIVPEAEPNAGELPEGVTRLIVDERNDKIFIEQIGMDGEESYAVAVCQMYGNEDIDRKDAAELVRRYNTFPDMLEALEDLVDAVPKQTEDADWWEDNLTDAYNKAKAAIQSATK